MRRLVSFLVAAVAILTVSVGLLSCKGGKGRYRVSYTAYFYTVCSFTAYCTGEKEFRTASGIVENELSRLHRLFDIYNAYEGVNNIKTLNDAAGKNPVLLDDDIIALLRFGTEKYNETDGKLNIAFGSVLSLWHGFFEGGSLPDGAELLEASEHCDIGGLSIDGSNVYLSDALMSIDVGAIGKGYACEKCAQLLISNGFSDFALDFGGNIRTSGSKNGQSWSVGVSDPKGDGYAAVLSLEKGGSVVTSGDYQRFRTVGDVRYHHIISTDTLMPTDKFTSVTVICEDSATADFLSTSLFCTDIGNGEELAMKYRAQAMWITADGQIYKTEGFSDYEQ